MAAWRAEQAYLDLLLFQMCLCSSHLYLYAKHYCPENLPIRPFHVHTVHHP